MGWAEVNAGLEEVCDREGVLEAHLVVVNLGRRFGHERHSLLIRHQETNMCEEIQQCWKVLAGYLKK